MGICKFICAVITRALFILVSLVGVFRVTSVKNDCNYWFLTFLFLPLVTEMIITLKRRKGKDYKWFSPPIFLFLISIIPLIWILELHHQENKSSGPECHKLDSRESLKKIVTSNETSRNSIFKFAAKLKNLKAVLASVCSNDWILALHQILLILLIVGKWLLPLGGGVTKDELLELLLVFVGTAADILELTNEILSDVKWVTNKEEIMHSSMLNVPFHLNRFEFFTTSCDRLSRLYPPLTNSGQDGLWQPYHPKRDTAGYENGWMDVQE
ncbi:transmembrane protein 26-like [Oryzias latipes]|uniref:transmembrane protein 26-like n=1 Tax=Oryzias latipes TaxID=8090 RepID=UPI0009DA95B5|nr:transmembrane protein 26-like [Oryzias latipes]